MIGKWLNYMSKLHDGVDAILIADRHGVIEYSAMFSEQENGLIDEGFIGKHIWLIKPHKGLYILDDIVTQNPEMLMLKETALRVAANPSPVLVWGETGTGKGLFAQALHFYGALKYESPVKEKVT